MRPPAEAIGSLGLIVGAIAFVIFIGVEAALIFAAWRYRASRAVGPVPQVQGNRPLEIAWTAIPVLILAAVFVVMLGTMNEIGASSASGGGPAAIRVTARGYQWWWEFRYPTDTGDVVTANELHIPAGNAVDLDLVSADVVHSFWVPAISGKTDLVPGKTNHLRLFAREPGTYSGQCAEFCGVEHAWMRITVIAESNDAFHKWLKLQSNPRLLRDGSPVISPVAPGEPVFLANVCVSCHTIRGTPAAGTAGPDLTHFGGRSTVGAGVLKNDDVSLRRWLADPQGVKPGILMPRVPLSDADLDALVDYLEALK